MAGRLVIALRAVSSVFLEDSCCLVLPFSFAVLLCAMYPAPSSSVLAYDDRLCGSATFVLQENKRAKWALIQHNLNRGVRI